MKVLFIVAVITCFILVVSAQNCDPEQKVNEIYPCASEINATTVTADFCRNCVNTLIKFSQDCPELNLIVYGEKIDINAEIKRCGFKTLSKDLINMLYTKQNYQ